MQADRVGKQQLYDRIGQRYSSRRHADPRWARTIRAAIGDATTILNIGAGAGSYEPPDLDVVALDPSITMLTQRPRVAPPCVAASAEAIPFRDEQFDASTCVLTIHHWLDWRRGLAEVKRVTRRRIIVVTADVFREDMTFWLKDYFAEIDAWDRTHVQRIDDVLAELWPARVEVLPVPADCTDGFCGAYWRRPAAYLDPEVRAGVSGFNLIPTEAVDRGVRNLRIDLDTGRWHERYGRLLDKDQIDIGYRLIVAERC
jgi:SAM-dependent methyltransferase